MNATQGGANLHPNLHPAANCAHEHGFSDIHTDVLCYPGYKVEELLLEPDVVSYIPGVSVSVFQLQIGNSSNGPSQMFLPFC